MQGLQAAGEGLTSVPGSNGSAEWVITISDIARPQRRRGQLTAAPTLSAGYLLRVNAIFSGGLDDRFSGGFRGDCLGLVSVIRYDASLL